MTRSTAPLTARRQFKPLCLAVTLAIQAQSGWAQDNAAEATHLRDWENTREVPGELRDARCELCGGRYVDPLRNEDRNQEPEQADISASTSSSELHENRVNFSGGVEVTQGYRRLRADSATFDRERRAGDLQGNIVLREPGLLLEGDSAHVESETGEASISDSNFVLHQQHLRGSADLLERDSEGILHVHNGRITYCAPTDNDWSIQAKALELDIEEGLATAYHAKIKIADVPVFYSPWMQFPLDDRRRTGFLWPDFGSDSKGGLDVSVPVYFNLAPNYDLLYAPRYIQERGVSHETTARYMHPLVGKWQAGGAYIGNDERYADEYPAEKSDDRWLLMVRQNGLFNNNRLRSRIDYSKASDVNYLKDLDSASLDSRRQTALLQLGALDYLGDSWLVNLEAQQFQTLADDISNDYKKLPQLTANYRPDGMPFEIDPILLAQYSSFDSDDDRVTGTRLYTEAGATYPMQWSYGFVRPTAKYRLVSYDLNQHGRFTEQSPESAAPMFNLDSGLYFDRQTSLAGKGMLQTLEPRLYYLYSAYQDQTDQPDFDSAELTFTYNQLFRETRFSGHDRIDDANQLSLGLSSRFIDEEDGREEFYVSFGQIIYFRDREVRLGPAQPAIDTGGSELAGELGFFPNERFSVRGSAVWDPYNNQMNTSNMIASYLSGDGRIYNLGYNYRRPLTTVNEDQNDTEQVHVSTYLPLGRNWRLFGAVNYSLQANTSVEDMFGVEYDSCCWKVRLLHLRYYDNDTTGQMPDFNDPQLEREKSIQFQIVLKGMGGFGSRASGLMKDMIRGFVDSEY